MRQNFKNRRSVQKCTQNAGSNARLHVYGNNRGLLQIFDLGKHRELLITWYIMARMPEL